MGIEGNERADSLAKKGSHIIPEKSSLNFESMKRIIKRKTQNKFLEHTQQIIKGKKWKGIRELWDQNKNKPRREAVATFRLATGHDCLAAHLQRISILPSANCTICQQEDSVMNDAHLPQCPVLNPDKMKNIVQLYWEARRLMA